MMYVKIKQATKKGYELCEIGGVASLSRNNLFSTQFHPEKSGKQGLKILKNFINLK